MEFNIVGHLMLSSGNLQSQLSGIFSQLQSQARSLNIPVNIGINPQQQAALTGLNTALGHTRTGMQAVQSASLATATAMQTVARASVDATGFMENLATQTGVAARRFLAFAAAGGTLVQLARGFRETISQAISFERQMNVISQISTESAQEVAGLATEVGRLATSLGVPSQQLVSVAEKLKQTGLSVREVKTALSSLAEADLPLATSARRRLVQSRRCGNSR